MVSQQEKTNLQDQLAELEVEACQLRSVIATYSYLRKDVTRQHVAMVKRELTKERKYLGRMERDIKRIKNKLNIR